MAGWRMVEFVYVGSLSWALSQWPRWAKAAGSGALCVSWWVTGVIIRLPARERIRDEMRWDEPYDQHYLLCSRVPEYVSTIFFAKVIYQQFNPFGLHLLLSWVSEFYRMTFLNLLRDTVKLWKFFCSLNLFFDIDQVDPWINMIPSGHRGKIICCISLHASLKKTSLIS